MLLYTDAQHKLRGSLWRRVYSRTARNESLKITIPLRAQQPQQSVFLLVYFANNDVCALLTRSALRETRLCAWNCIIKVSVVCSATNRCHRTVTAGQSIITSVIISATQNATRDFRRNAKPQMCRNRSYYLLVGVVRLHTIFAEHTTSDHTGGIGMTISKGKYLPETKQEKVR